MATGKILYATDYSELSEYALPVAAALAREHDATLLIVHVSESEEYPPGELFDEESTPPREELDQLHAVKPFGPHISCEYRLLYGDPAKAILKLADEERPLKIVMSSHGRTGFSRVLAGSVAEEVLREAACEVVIVKKPTAAP